MLEYSYSLQVFKTTDLEFQTKPSATFSELAAIVSSMPAA